MIELIDSIGFEIVPVTATTARRVMDIHRRWGKGVHPAALNFGDCFAYDVAETYDALCSMWARTSLGRTYAESCHERLEDCAHAHNVERNVPIDDFARRHPG